MTELRYPFSALFWDYARGIAGTVLCFVILVTIEWHNQLPWLFVGLTVLFAIYTMTTIAKNVARFRVSEEGIECGGFRKQSIRWGDLSELGLRYYPTSRSRKKGWMTLTLKAKASPGGAGQRQDRIQPARLHRDRDPRRLGRQGKQTHGGPGNRGQPDRARRFGVTGGRCQWTSPCRSVPMPILDRNSGDPMAGSLLAVRGLKIAFDLDTGVLEAVRGIDFRVPHGKTVALVGESGSGKSVVAQAIMGILPKIARISGGQILFDRPGRTAMARPHRHRAASRATAR